MRTLGFRLSDGEKFERPGDTHFAFAVPERAFEDVAVLAEAIRVGLLTERFAACLLMTDFANPIFSSRRAKLLDRVPASATVTAGHSEFSAEMAAAIVAAADGADESSPEREFAKLWAVGEIWREECNRRLDTYYAAVTARLPEPVDEDAVAWSRVVAGIFRRHAQFPQVYDPTVTDTPPDALPVKIVWTAFPARLLRGATSQEQRWARADSERAVQDEYCEWSVERNDAGTITRVTVSTEVPEYWAHIAARDPNRLLALYRRFVDPRVNMSDLFVDGAYEPENRWNSSTRSRPAHMVQVTNKIISKSTFWCVLATMGHARGRRPGS